MSCAVIVPPANYVHPAPLLLPSVQRPVPPTPKQRALADQMMHPHILHQVLDHVPRSSLVPLMRVNKQFYHVASEIVYRSVSYFPDRRGPTAFDGIEVVQEAVRNPLTGYMRTRRNLKKDCLRRVRNLHLGYHHHNHSQPTEIDGTPIFSAADPSCGSSRVSLDIQLPALRSLHVTGERFCTYKSCPYLHASSPSSVTVVKIDLFSGSPRWKNAFELPAAQSAKRAVYLCQSPFFLRKATMQGLSPASARVASSTFIFALRAHEVEWRDTARRMSDRDGHGVLVEHLATLALSPALEINIVGTELVACHLRPDPVLLSTRPEDITDAFYDAVAARVSERWAEEGNGGCLEDQLRKVRFMTLRHYAAKHLREEEVPRDTIEGWADCFESVVASSGLAIV